MSKRTRAVVIAGALAGAIPASFSYAVTETFSNGVPNDFSTGLYAGTQATTLEVVSSNSNDPANFGGETTLQERFSSGNRFRFALGFNLSSITPYASQISLNGVAMGLTQAFSEAGSAGANPLNVNAFSPNNAGWLQGSGLGTLPTTTGPWASGSYYATTYSGHTTGTPWLNATGGSAGLLSGGSSTTGPFQLIYNQSSSDPNVEITGHAVGTHYTETDSTGKLKAYVSTWIGTPSQNAGMFIGPNGGDGNPAEFYNDNIATIANRPQMLLTISSPTMSTDWNVDTGDVWSNNSDWDNGSPNTIGATANFGNVITAPRTITLDGPKVVSSLNFDSPQGYTLSGSNPITLLEVNNGQATINVNSGNHTISTPLVIFTNTAINVPGGSVLELDGPISAAAKTVGVSGGGQLTLGSASVLNSLAGSSGAALTMNGGVLQIKPHAAGADSAAAPTALTLNSGAELDLTNNDLVFTYSGTNTPVSTVRSLLVSGYNGGNWNGSGYGTSLASATEGLGYAEAADVGITNFDGTPVTTAVLVKYTYYGDSSLDGKVDLGNDFNLFLQGFLGLLPASWETGDYNYNGSVNMDDFSLFIQGYAGQGGSLGDLEQVIANSGELSAGQRAALLAVAPEPGSLAVLAAVAGAASLRRRRNHA